jgi:hypothetical protein
MAYKRIRIRPNSRVGSYVREGRVRYMTPAKTAPLGSLTGRLAYVSDHRSPRFRELSDSGVASSFFLLTDRGGGEVREYNHHLVMSDGTIYKVGMNNFRAYPMTGMGSVQEPDIQRRVGRDKYEVVHEPELRKRILEAHRTALEMADFGAGRTYGDSQLAGWRDSHLEHFGKREWGNY